MRTPKITTKRVLGLVLAGALAVSGTVALASSSEAAVGSYTVLPKTGPVTAGAVLTINGAGFQTTAGARLLFAGATAVQFTASTCPSVHGTASSTVLDATVVSIASAKKLTVTAPALALSAAPKPQGWNVCVYGTANSNALLGTAKYTSYAVASISAANTPATGPAAGGNSVVITGTGFTSASKVKFGTFASPKVTVAKDGLSITAVAPAQAASSTAVNVVVTTEAGVNTTSSTFDNYTYVNAITLSPVSGDGTAGNILTVNGVGFKGTGYDFSSPNGAASSVYLSSAAYDGSAPPAKYCSTVQVVSDTELTCTLPVLTDGPYTVFVVKTKATTNTASVVSAAATYTAADF